MRLRVRTDEGAQSIVDLHDAATADDLSRAIALATGVSEREQELRVGFPARVVDTSDGRASLDSLGVRSGETIAVRRVLNAGAAGDVPVTRDGGSLREELASMDEDEALARALALSMEENGGGATSTSANSNATHAVRRVIESDNSCLFNAVAYCAERSLREAPRLRRVVADAVARDADTFNEAFLGKPPKEYMEWITRPNTWGGQVELFILASHYRVEIAAYDIQTERCDVYGEGAGYDERIMVIYDGLHYDAIVLHPSPTGADASKDVTRVPAGASLPSVVALVRQQHAAKKYTDTANFSLRCLVCQKGLVGQTEAVAHAKSTGHANFGEY